MPRYAGSVVSITATRTGRPRDRYKRRNLAVLSIDMVARNVIDQVSFM